MRLGYTSKFWCDKMGLCSEEKDNQEEEWKKLSEFVWFEDAEEPMPTSLGHQDLVNDVKYINTPFVPFHVVPKLPIFGRIAAQYGGEGTLRRKLENTLSALKSN